MCVLRAERLNIRLGVEHAPGILVAGAVKPAIDVVGAGRSPGTAAVGKRHVLPLERSVDAFEADVDMGRRQTAIPEAEPAATRLPVDRIGRR